MHSTSGIVLNHVKYSETSVIIHIYTEKFGRQSYLVNGIRKSRNKGKAILLQPLTLLQMEVTYHEKKDIHRIVDFRVSQPFRSIPFDQTKRAITFFIAELLSKVLREEQANQDLFNFLFHAIEVLDESLHGLANYHLFFMFQLSRFLGFAPSEPAAKVSAYFDLKNGIFLSAKPQHPYYLHDKALKNWIQLYSLKADQLNELQLNTSSRRELLDALILYYELHMLQFSSLKSPDVLHALFE
jgi:DNA repair protein RecO (recombination protein O)